MVMDRRTVLAGAATAGLAGCAAPLASSGPTTWEPRASLPWVAQEINGAVVGHRVHVAGGLVGRGAGPRGVLDRTAVYDARADRWTEGPRLPAPTHHPAMAAARGQVFALGGFREGGGGQWRAGRTCCGSTGIAGRRRAACPRRSRRRWPWSTTGLSI